MSKTARKIITALSVILFVLLLSSLLPVIKFGQAYAEAATPQPVVQAEEGVTEVPYPRSEILQMTYNAQAWNIDSLKLYQIVKIEDEEGNTLAKAVDAGNYTVYVKPAENCVWEEDGTTDEKPFTLTINQATIRWTFNDEILLENNKEITYSGDNVILKVVAKGAYNYTVTVKNLSGSAQFGGLEVFEKLENGELKEIKKQVQFVGEYVFKLKEIYDEFDGSNLYKNYINPEFTLKITKERKNIGSSVNLNWVPAQGEFVSGKVYEYDYKENGTGKTVYLTHKFEQSPFESWTEWTYIGESEVKRAILAHCEGIPRRIELEHSKPGDTQYFVRSGSDPSGYDGVFAATESGKYEVSTVIRPSVNYDIYYEPDGTLSTEVVDNHDGTYTVSKTWYIALFINEFLDIASADPDVQEKIPYQFPSSWTFGTLPEGGVNFPYAAHGDELTVNSIQPEGYWLSANKGGKWVNVAGEPIASDEWIEGEDDIVTFTLKSGDTVICEDQPRCKYDDYINKYMPVGNYSITFTLKDINYGTAKNHNAWWNGVTATSCGIEYRGITASYDFEVLAGTLLFDDSSLNFANKDNPVPFRVEAGSVNGDFENFFGVANSKVVLGEGMITKGEVEKSGTYWATVADKYYSEAVELKYHLKSADDFVFHTASDEIWNSLINDEGTYYVYYTVNLLNYNSAPADEDLATEFAKQFFIIELKGNLASGFGIGRIFLYVGITLVGIGAIVAVVILLIKKRNKPEAAEDDAEEVQLEIGGLEEPVPVSEPIEEPEQSLTENPDEVQQTIDDGFDEPVEEESAQPVEEEKPVEEEPAQPVEEQKLVEEEPVQPVEEQKLVEEEPAQPTEEEKLVEEEPAQPTEEEKPVEEEPAQPVEEQKPVEEEPAQPVEEQKLVEEEPAQPVEEQKPAEEEPAQPEPVRLTEEQLYEADMAYIEQIMEQAQEEYDAKHKDDAEQQPAQPEEGNDGENDS